MPSQVRSVIISEQEFLSFRVWNVLYRPRELIAKTQLLWSGYALIPGGFQNFNKVVQNCKVEII